jgi:iron complex outermembrane receptor protein
MNKGISKIVVGLMASTAIAAPAWAQDAGAPADQAATAPQVEEDIVVTGIRASQAAAIDIKRDETAIVDAISAEDIGKLPDVTIVDALQRIPGVQIQRSAGEGSTVNIRGLPQVVTLLNGEQYLSPGNLGTAQPRLDDIPAQLMNAVVVYKSQDLRNALSGISGTIDLRTRRPFDLKSGFTLSAQAEYSRGTHTKENDYLVSGLASWRNETIGVMVGATKSNSNLGNSYAGIAGSVFGNNDWGGSGSNWISPHGWEFFNRELERDRLGINAAVQLQIADGFTLTGEVFHTEMVEHNRAAGVNISNRWSGLGWTTPTNSTPSGQNGGNGQPWLDVSEYDLDVWWFNSFSVNRTLRERSTNYNLSMDYDNDENFKFSARALRSNAHMRSMNGQVQGDLSNWRPAPTRAFTLFRNAADPTRGTFYPANIASQYPSSRYTNSVVGSRGGRYVDPNPLGYGDDPQLHINFSGQNPVITGFDRALPGGLGAGKTLKDYMANLDSYAIGAFSSEGNQENSADLGVFRADGSYEFEDGGLFGMLGRVDVGVRRSDRSTQIRAFHLFSNFYGGNGATVAAGCSAQWKAIDVVMDQNQCQAGEQVPNPSFNPALPVSATNPTTVFQGYTVNRPTRLDEHNNVYFQTDWGGVVDGVPGIWVADPRDFDDAKAFHERVFGGADEITIPGSTYDVDLVEESAYANTAWESGGLKANLGLKVINTKLTVKQNLTGETRNYGDTNLDTGDVVSRRSYLDWLPTATLSYDFTPQLRLRAAFAKTMIPLDLGNYGGGLTISTADSQGPTPTNPNAAPLGVRQVTGASSSGNPNLNPWRSNNYDLSLEYYLGRASLLNVSLFKLDINSFVQTLTIPDGARYPDQDGVIRRSVPLTQPAQGEGGSLQGIELGAKLAFSDFMGSGFLRNFGLEANYTLSDSEQNGTSLDGERLPFPDNSKHQVNVVGWYQDDHLQLRVAYNYRTPRLMTTFGQIPIFQDTAQYVDANLTYNINDQFAFYVNGSNVLGERERYYFQFDDDSRQYHSQNRYEPRYSAGVRVRF